MLMIIKINKLKRNQRGGKMHSELENESCMKNMPPGSPKLSILSFERSFHGRTLGGKFKLS